MNLLEALRKAVAQLEVPSGARRAYTVYTSAFRLLGRGVF